MPRRVVKVRHSERRRVGEWDPAMRRWLTFSPSCTCGWIGESVTDRRMAHDVWAAHVAAAKAVEK